MAILNDAVNARWRIGFTGTMELGDVQKEHTLEAYIGPLLKRVTNKKLMMDKWIIDVSTYLMTMKAKQFSILKLG